MSVGKKAASSRRSPEEEEEEEAVMSEGGGGEGGGRRKKAVRYDRCFSGIDLKIGPGPLKDLDAGKLKRDIRKWAKAVVAYARQLSFGSPRSSSSSSSASRSRRAAIAASPSDHRDSAHHNPPAQ